MVLNVIPFSSLPKKHRNISPGSVGRRLPGVNDMLTCSRPGLSVGLAHDDLATQQQLTWYGTDFTPDKN